MYIERFQLICILYLYMYIDRIIIIHEFCLFDFSYLKIILALSHTHSCLGVLVPSVVAKKWNYEISHPFLTFYFIISCTTLRRKDERPFFDGFDRRRTGNQNLGELRQAIVGFKTGSKRFKLGSKKRPTRTRSNLFPYPRLNMFR